MHVRRLDAYSEIGYMVWGWIAIRRLDVHNGIGYT